MLASTSWRFGWDALASVGTVLAALVTAWVAMLTQRSVRIASRAADLAREELTASWRPVVMPISAQASLQERYGQRLIVTEVDYSNIGAGPALAVQTWEPDPQSTVPVAEGPAIPVGGHIRSEYEVDEKEDDDLRIRARYRDLGGRHYETSALIIRYRFGLERCNIFEVQVREIQPDGVYVAARES